MSFIEGKTIHGFGASMVPHKQWSALPEQFWDFWSLSHPNFHSEGLGQTNSKCSKHKISRAPSKRSLPEIQEGSQRGGELKDSKGTFTSIEEPSLEFSASVFESHLLAKWSNDKTKTIEERVLLSFIPRKTIHRLGEYSASQEVESSSYGRWARTSGNTETGLD